MNSKPFDGRLWPLSQAVIDHIELVLGVDKNGACAALQTALRDGAVRARGPIQGKNASLIDGEYFRFNRPKPDGGSDGFDAAGRPTWLPWFEVDAEGAFREWLLPVVPERDRGTAVEANPEQKHASEVTIRETIRAIHQRCKNNGEYCPNVVEVRSVAKLELDRRGYKVSGNRIGEIAGEYEFKKDRLRSGQKKVR